jgi:hypothetical protein
MGGGRCAAARIVISCSLANFHQLVEASAKNSKTQAVDSAARCQEHMAKVCKTLTDV